MKVEYIEYAAMFRALSDPNRLLILDYLLEGERCACVILEKLQITQSTLSYHMKILSESEIVTARKEGKWMHYALNRAKLDNLKMFIDLFTSKKSGNHDKCS